MHEFLGVNNMRTNIQEFKVGNEKNQNLIAKNEVVTVNH